MKNILLGTALLVVMASPAYAESEVPHDVEVVETVVEEAAVVEEAVVEANAVDEDVVIEDVSVDAVEEREVPAELVTEPLKAEASVEQDIEEVVAEAAADAVVEVEKGVHWGYTGEGAAQHWGDLKGDYHACSAGKEQSPINIARFLQEDQPDIKGTYVKSPLVVVNNGHSVQVNFAEGSSMSVDGTVYNLLQAHFHTPSEHYLDGAPYPMEVHFVHQTADGVLGVVGVMMKVGESHPAIEGIWQNVPAAGETKEVVGVELSASDLLPESLDYYKYHGSLTTPPCTEKVQWHVLKDTIEISESQLRAFQSVFPVNARPVQPLNDRVVTGD